MNPFLSTATGLPARRSTLDQMVQQSTALLMTSIGALILLLALLILFHENATATEGYKLRTLEHQRSSLLLEQEIVNMQVAQQQAIETLQKDKRITSMLTLNKAGYIQADQSVAFQPAN